MRNRSKEQVASRVVYILALIGEETLDRMSFSLHHEGYGEPGYTDPPTGLIALANWNNLNRDNPLTKQREIVSTIPERLSSLLEKLGVSIEWHDEWRSCDECGKLLRIHADSHGWKPSYYPYSYEKAEFVCLSCNSHGWETSDQTIHDVSTNV